MSSIIQWTKHTFRSSVLHNSIGLLLLVAVSAWGWTVFASLDAPSGPTDPSSQSYTLADVCTQLQTGAEPTIATSFTEPESAPDQDMCSLSSIYDLLPEPDPTNAAQSSDVQSGTVFWALDPNGEWGQRTGTGNFTILTDLVMATGQTSCYRFNNNNETTCGSQTEGQDGFYQFGATADPRFTDNTDGTVTDNVTGLIWLKNANCFGTRVWETALNDANSLASGSCGLTDGSVAGDWRLPNVNELASLIDYETDPSPRIPTGHPFASVLSSNYWSSTTYRPDPAHAWNVNFNTGVVNDTLYPKTHIYYVWPVR